MSQASTFLRAYRAQDKEGMACPDFNGDSKCVTSIPYFFALFEDGSVIGEKDTMCGLGIVSRKGELRDILRFALSEASSELTTYGGYSKAFADKVQYYEKAVRAIYKRLGELEGWVD